MNKLGFHIVEFFNSHHPDPNEPEGCNEVPTTDERDGMFRFEKIMGGSSTPDSGRGPSFS